MGGAGVPAFAGDDLHQRVSVAGRQDALRLALCRPSEHTVKIERFQGQDLVRIGNDDSYLLLAPAHGGRLVRWVHQGQDILYWPADADWTRVAKVRGGNPLLFPFIGRHFVDGQAGRWRDKSEVVRDMPQHGFARDLPFVVSHCADTAVSMTLTDSEATRSGYPFAFAFTATYRLLQDGLEVTLDVHNRGDQPLPWYAGHHFYFAVPHTLRGECIVHMPAAKRMRQTADGDLSAAEHGDPAYRLDDPRLQDSYHVLAEPAATARLQGPSPLSRVIDIELAPSSTAPWCAITTWSEREDADFYCVEPWLGLPNAIHHGRGLHWVDANSTQSATCRLLVASGAGTQPGSS